MRPRNYARYHTSFRIAVYSGLVPDSALADIPKSTLSDMRCKPLPAYVGAEYAHIQETVEICKLVAEHKQLKALVYGLVRLICLFKAIRLPFHKIATVKAPELRNRIVGVVQRVSTAIPLSRILSFLDLPRARFDTWARDSKPCVSSPLGHCRSRHPNQLTLQEIGTIKRAYSSFNPETTSMYAFASRLVHTGEIACSPDTIVQYVKKLGLAVPVKLPKRRRKLGSIAATQPDQTWHADVTYVSAQDGAKTAVHLVIDNCSRKIIAYRMVDNASKESLIEALTEAHNAIPSSRRALPDTTVLITDGGSENDNGTVKSCVHDMPLKHIIAQRDVTFSNSIIEAANKILKYRYIFRNPIMRKDQIAAAVKVAIEAYNDRPHYALRGLTPNEVYAGMIIDMAEYRARLAEAHTNRVAANRASCPPCVPLEEALQA